MPFQDAIADVLLRAFLQTASYWTGWVVLKLLTGGRILLAPFEEKIRPQKSKEKAQRGKWGIWVHAPKKARRLRSEVVQLVGLLLWLLLGLFSAYLFSRNG